MKSKGPFALFILQKRGAEIVQNRLQTLRYSYCTERETSQPCHSHDCTLSSGAPLKGQSSESVRPKAREEALKQPTDFV